MSGHHPAPGPRGGDGPPSRPAPAADRRPRGVFVVLVPLVLVLTAVATVAGYGYGKSAGETHERNDLALGSEDGVRTPLRGPKSPAPEPFVSSMPRPTATRLNTAGAPVSVVGPTFDADQRTRTLSPNLPFSFRVPKGTWKTDTPPPGRDIAFAAAFSRPSGTESADTSPLAAVFAWRACGACTADDVPTFDERFREHHGLPAFQLRGDSAETEQGELTEGSDYYVVVRHLFDAPDGNTYLVDYATTAPADQQEQAQQLANEILTQMS